MNLTELLDETRSRLEDRVIDGQDNEPRWTDTDLINRINEAEREACWRKRLLIDSSFPALGTASAINGDAMTRVSVSANLAVYDLDPKVIFVRKVRYGTQAVPLAATDYRDMDKSFHGWDAATGTVERYITGLDAPGQLKLRLFRIPTATATAYLTVVREPLADMAQGTDEPEINARWHMWLVDWVQYRCYSDPDPDKFNLDLAGKHLALFEASFGTRQQAEKEETALQQATANPMAYADGTY